MCFLSEFELRSTARVSGLLRTSNINQQQRTTNQDKEGGIKRAIGDDKRVQIGSGWSGWSWEELHNHTVHLPTVYRRL
jgi:hypothetical protein